MNSDRKKLLYKMLSTALTLAGDYMKDFENINIEMEMDPEVNKCKNDLYMLLLSGSCHPKFEILLEEFCNEFTNLSKEKQEYIKMDYLKIIKEKNENNKEGEKKL